MTTAVDTQAQETDMHPQVRSALERLILTLADSKRLLGIRYSDWVLGAPSIETGIAASSMAQDEWGHARLLYAMLKQLDVDPKVVEHERSEKEYANVGPLDRPASDWAELVCLVALVDAAITTVLSSFSGGRFELAQSRVPKMLAEEEFHIDFGNAWFARLTNAGGDAAASLRRAAVAMLPELLAWVSPKDDAHARLAKAGIIGPAEALRESYVQRIAPLLAGLDIDPNGIEPAAGWDDERARGPGHPGLEAVERARGDKNRSLLVE